MKNFIQEGDSLDVITPSGGYVSGTCYKFGSIMGVAVNTSIQGDPNVLKRTGVFELPKNSAEAWVVGDPLFYDATSKGFSKTAGGSYSVKAGFAAAAAANPSAVGRVLLIGHDITDAT